MPGSPLALDRAAVPVNVQPGGEIVLRGSFQSTHDGSVIDAATTTWPGSAPGGASVDARGLVDFEAGGFHMTARDPVKHEVRAVATGEDAPACSALGVQSPCLPLRVVPQAQSRLLTVSDYRSSLKGAMTLEVVGAPVYAPAAVAANRHAGSLAAAAAALVLVVAGAFVLRRRRRLRSSPAGQLRELARRVRTKIGAADAVVAAPLLPAIEAAMRALGKRRVDPTTPQGKRVEEVLLRVEARLDETLRQAEAEAERAVADELVREMESAIEAAEEAHLDAPRRAS
jgi:hypothetical protein